MCVCGCVLMFVTWLFVVVSLRGEEEIAPGMKVWRKALSEVRNSSQLAMCLQQLQKSIAWERSIMKVVSVCVCVCDLRLGCGANLCTMMKRYFKHVLSCVCVCV